MGLLSNHEADGPDRAVGSNSSARSPQAVIEEFNAAYPGNAVELLLWQFFKTYALNADKRLETLTQEQQQIVALFDDLVELIAAVQESMGAA
jgi:hypothetical protein